MTSKRVLVTGGSGFIGLHLIKRLLIDGWNVYLIAKPTTNLQLLQGILGSDKVFIYDGSMISLSKAFSISRPNVIFHLATLYINNHHSSDVTNLVNSNILFGTQILECARNFCVKKFINTGTNWQHSQNTAYKAVNLYAATKQAFEDILNFYVAKFSLDAISLHLPDVYGPNDNRKKIVSLLIDAAIKNETISLSPGRQQIDLLHVNDVVDALLLSTSYLLNDPTFSGHNTYCLSSRQFISLVELSELIQDSFGIKIKAKWGAHPYRDSEIMVPLKYFPALPGWDPKTSLVDGLKTLT
jgi:nucleoside-diphosphate-sugar epimerase